MWKKSDSSEDMTYEPTQSAPSAGATAPIAHSRAPAAGSGRSSELGTIGPSISIRGEVTGDEDLVILGHIEGMITLPNHDVTLGKDARVKANVSAKQVIVEGQVEGDVNGKEVVTIRHSGSVQGNISAQRVVLEDGCRFSGSIDMGGPGNGAQDSKKAATRAPVSDIKPRETAATT
ncbi:MAG: polymer-forming cytoskeletal protein [Gammaproteobacteria bacterium]|nr:polymer-forming cytoskeletal protein [Gammaproteobacteria bacterium]MDH3469413.1 polymer-forming cytoskeletal protein [Gammaproteobacteria bacterium]